MATPAEILHLGAEPGELHFNLGCGFPTPTGHRDVPVGELYAGYSVEEGNTKFVGTPDGTGVIFRVGVDGGRTPNTKYPRMELRELDQAGNLMAFDPSKDEHLLAGRAVLAHLAPAKPWVSIAQMHSGTGDAIQILTRVDTGALRLGTYIGGAWRSKGFLLDKVAEGDTIDWTIHLVGGTASISVAGGATVTADFSTHTTADMYFKVGNYAQSAYPATEPVQNEYFEVIVSHLRQWHTGWPTSYDEPKTGDDVADRLTRIEAALAAQDTRLAAVCADAQAARTSAEAVRARLMGPLA